VERFPRHHSASLARYTLRNHLLQSPLVRLRRYRIPPSIHLPPRWRRSGAGTLVALLVAAVIAFDQSRRSPASSIDEERYHQKKARVVHIVDGDTFDVDIPDRTRSTTRLRLWGVDAPELAKSNEEAMYYGGEARAFAETTLLRMEISIVLSPTRTRDKYGRLLAYVYLQPQGSSFNQMLIDEGLAYADRRFDHPFADDFLMAEKRARRERKGLWAEVTRDRMPEWRRKMELNSRG
jgi:micrococcal nuclease